MPNTREQLIALLKEVQDNGAICHPAGFGETYDWVRNSKVADHLIANGVTIQDDHHWATEQAYKNGYADGVKEFCQKLHTEILDARNSNFKAKGERIEKYGAEDGFTMYCDGKIHALDGIDYYADSLAKEMVGADNG